jgi:hypothetical protein
MERDYLLDQERLHSERFCINSNVLLVMAIRGKVE